MIEITLRSETDAIREFSKQADDPVAQGKTVGQIIDVVIADAVEAGMNRLTSIDVRFVVTTWGESGLDAGGR